MTASLIASLPGSPHDPRHSMSQSATSRFAALERRLPGLHAPRDLGLEALVGRLVESAADQLVGQMLLIGDPALLVVRVLIAAAVAELLHQRRRRVADHQRRRQAAGALGLVERGAEAAIDGVALGRGGEIGATLRQRQLTLGRAELV